MSKRSSYISLTHLEEMVLHKKTGSIPVASKPYSLPLKHHTFIKEELTNLLEAGLIEWPLSPYDAAIMVVPCKTPAGSSLTEAKRLVMDYQELNKQLPKVQMVLAKTKGTILLIETAKIYHIWAKIRDAWYFSSLEIRAGYHISIHPDSRPKTVFICPYGKFQWKCISFSVAHALIIFLNAMFKLFFEYLDDFPISYEDDIIVYSKLENEHLAHLRKVFGKFCYAGMKLKSSKCDFFELHIEYLCHLISGTGIYPLEQKIQAILGLAPPTNVTQVWHILGLVSYYRKFIPLFSSIVSPITALMKRNTPFVWMVAC